MSDVNSTYDYVVVGAGSAGCVVAARLSEDPQCSVLVLEAGPSGEDYPAIDVPAQVASLQQTDIDWSFQTVPQQNAAKGYTDERQIWPRGKVLGGTSCLNYMAYVRGHSADYDSWERLGCEGWGWKDVLPYFMKSENNTCKECTDPEYHKTGGPLTISNHDEDDTSRTRFSRDFIKAGVELGYPECVDINSGNNLGFGDCPATIKNGQRASAAKAFLRPAMARQNLKVVTNAYVTKILIENQTAVGVEFTVGEESQTVKVNKEVAVCSGAVNSPQILMLSGIGPRSHLESLGIKCVVDLPVGKNLQDHLFIHLKGSADQGGGVLTLNDAVDPKHLEKYQADQTGLLTNNGLESVAFIKTGLENDIDWPDLQIHQISLFYVIGPNEPQVLRVKSKELYPWVGYDDNITDVMSHNGFTIIPVLLHPKSRGEITLSSADPKAPPIIDPHYLEHPYDVKVLIEGLRIAKKLADTDVMKCLGAVTVDIKKPGSSYDTFSDDNLEQYVRHFAYTVYHPVGTCKMGSQDDGTAVVDPKLRVRGIDGLRVIDASIMPHIVSGNTNAPAIMIGERGADFIKTSD